MQTNALRTGLLVTAAILVAASIFLPLWGMTLVSVQYPEGLRMVVYPTKIVGDITELNLLNHYIGMAEIDEDFFVELKTLPALFGVIALATVAAAIVGRWWAAIVPLAAMAGTAVYGFWSMSHRLYTYGHDLDPTAAMRIEPFTPPMFGEHVIAQFGTYSYFSWGTFLPAAAGLIVAYVLWRDVQGMRGERSGPQRIADASSELRADATTARPATRAVGMPIGVEG